MAEQVSFSFDLSSDTINYAIDRKLYEDHDIDGALQLVKNFTDNTQQTEEEKIAMAYDILNDRAKIVGTYPHDDYGVEYPDDCKNNHRLTDILQNLANKLNNSQKELYDLQRKWCFVCEDLSDWKRRELNNNYFEMYDEYLFPSEQLTPKTSSLLNGKLQEVVDRMTGPDDPEEYGWLEPNGAFHPVEWAKHAVWAKEYLDKHYPMEDEENLELYWCEDNGVRTHIVADEVLTRKLHWILLHDPWQGEANISMHISTKPTKAQKEFLYDYFMKRGRKEEANKIYEDKEGM